MGYRYFQITINPLLEDTFLLFISFSLVTQLAYVCLHLYYLCLWAEHWVMEIVVGGSAPKNHHHRIARALLYNRTVENTPELLDLVYSVIYQTVKLALLITGLVAVNNVWLPDKVLWHVTPLTFLISFFRHYDDTFLSEEVATEPEESTFVDRILRLQLTIMSWSHRAVLYLSVLCALNLIYVRWDDLRSNYSHHFN